MNKSIQWAALVILLAVVAAPAFADTLILKTGERVSGFFEGGSARVVKFRSTDGVLKDYDILAVQQVQFGDTTTSAAPATQPAPTPSAATTPAPAPASGPSSPQLR